MKAVLAVYNKDGDGKEKKKMVMVDTDTAKFVCDRKNVCGFVMEKIYMTPSGVLFIQDTIEKILRMPKNEEGLKEWIGQHDYKAYLKFFGAVEEG